MTDPAYCLATTTLREVKELTSVTVLRAIRSLPKKRLVGIITVVTCVLLPT
ncbi:hypothetical protein ACNKHR_20875 [Shigella flexneri]